jgi:hypothetical protein
MGHIAHVSGEYRPEQLLQRHGYRTGDVEPNPRGKDAQLGLETPALRTMGEMNLGLFGSDSGRLTIEERRDRFANGDSSVPNASARAHSASISASRRCRGTRRDGKHHPVRCSDRLGLTSCGPRGAAAHKSCADSEAPTVPAFGGRWMAPPGRSPVPHQNRSATSGSM